MGNVIPLPGWATVVVLLFVFFAFFYSQSCHLFLVSRHPSAVTRLVLTRAGLAVVAVIS